MSASELLSSPFPVFRHVQLVGDLLIIPPRWYVLGILMARGAEYVTVTHRIFGKGRLHLFRGRACQSMA
jgi:hypothetical protein